MPHNRSQAARRLVVSDVTRTLFISGQIPVDIEATCQLHFVVFQVTATVMYQPKAEYIAC